MNIPDNKWFATAVLCVLMAVGFVIRILPLSHWLENRDRYFFDEGQIPLMVTVDSYYYLDIAQELEQGVYRRGDERRHVPVGHTRTAWPPLLSIVLAAVSFATRGSLEWCALFMPTFLGCLVAVPVYLTANLYSQRMSGTWVGEDEGKFTACAGGLVAAGCTLVSPLYLERSSLGWFDTDMLNVSFALLLSLLGARLVEASRSAVGLVFFTLLYIAISILYFVWWEQSPLPVVFFSCLPFIFSMMRMLLADAQKAVIPSAIVMIFGLILVAWKGWAILDPQPYLHSVKSMFHYIVSSPENSPFRPAGLGVSEQSAVGLDEVIKLGFGWWPTFALAMLGLLILLWGVRWKAVYLAPIVAVAALSFYGVRFVLFIAPLLGLGIGTLIFFCFHLPLKRFFPRLLLAVACLAVVIIGVTDKIQNLKYMVPRRSPVLFDAMQRIKEYSPQDSVVWASWGHGHPLVFYGQRGVVADGIYHSAELQYVLNVPYATDNYRLAANWMSFYVAHGPEGLRRANAQFGKGRDDWAGGVTALQSLLSAGIEGGRRLLVAEYSFRADQIADTLRFLFPGNDRPLYLFIDYLMLNQAWYKLGKWNVADKEQADTATFIPLTGVAQDKDGSFLAKSRQGKVRVDLRSGQIVSGDKRAKLADVRVHDGRKLQQKTFYPQERLMARLFLPGGVGVIADRDAAAALLPKLYYEFAYNRRYVVPVDSLAPYYSLWKVHGDWYR